MPLVESQFNPNKLVTNGHLQTLYPYFFRKVRNLPLKRERIQTDDNDFLDLDCTEVESSSRCVILTHGLEGSSNTGYMRGMAKFLSECENPSDIISWNMRSCSGELNRSKFFYNASQTKDLDCVVNYALSKKKYKEIYLVAFSLGGNLTAYYLSQENGRIPSEVAGSILFSSVLDISSTINKLNNSKLGRFYTESFLCTMRDKVLKKHEAIGYDLDLEAIKKTRCFRSFDDLFTAPIYGYQTAEDYYRDASAAKLLDKIKVPTLIVQAKDDPFLHRKSFPLRAANKNPYLHLEIPKTGGHVGFLELSQGLRYWSETRTQEFIQNAA